jgi:hypothetical protein
MLTDERIADADRRAPGQGALPVFDCGALFGALDARPRR